MKYAWKQKTDIGMIGISEEDGKITNLWLNCAGFPIDFKEKETALLHKAFIQLEEYLSGKRKDFSLPLHPSGTVFQQKVWDALLNIPYGQTASYGDIAKVVGSPKASRAVGMANNKNPIAIFIPCHRVIGANKKLVGYGGGLHIKQKLLNLENANFKA